MNFFKSKLLTIVLVLCLVFTIFVGVTANRKENTGTVQDVVTSIVSPIQKYVFAAGQRIGNLMNFLGSISTLKNENADLKDKIDEFNHKLVEYDKIKRENEEMTKLLDLKNTRSDLKFKSANVIGKVGDKWFDIIVVDVGEDDGIKNGQYVVNSSGLIGQVLEVNKNTSKIITILDEKINIPGKVSSTGEDGVVSGLGSGKKCKIDYLNHDTSAKVGDAVVTSNIITDENIVIPADILIGFIEQLEDDVVNVNQKAFIKPVVDFSKLDKVMIIVR